MRLLVVTQAVDRNDLVLGFFHTWIEKLAAHVETLNAVCLKAGAYTLPANVHVYSLGKEHGRVSRLRYAWRFLSTLWRLRGTYDVVLVHMNQEYLLLAGWWWKLLGVRVVLWRNHVVGDLGTRLACSLAHTVCHTSPSAFVARYSHARAMPVGIDTDLFTPNTSPAPHNSMLFLGRLDPVKKPEVFLSATQDLARTHSDIHADVYGDPTPGRESFAESLRAQFAQEPTITFYPGVPHAQTAALYRAHAIYVNLTPAGSFDKTIGEAMASGCLVVSGNPAVQQVLDPALFVHDVERSTEVVRALGAALAMPADNVAHLVQAERAWVVQHHSLQSLITQLVAVLM